MSCQVNIVSSKKIKKMKKTIFYLLLILWATSLKAQTVIKDTTNVRFPKTGRLYFETKNNELYLYKKNFEKISTKTELKPPSELPTQPPKPLIPPPDNVVIKEKKHIGTIDGMPVWKVIFTDNFSRSYIYKDKYFQNVGINIYANPAFKINPGQKLEEILDTIIDDVTGNGGLDPSRFHFKFEKLGVVTPSDLIKGDRKNGFLKFQNETIPNRISWENFPDATLPTGHFATLGWGLDVWKDDPIGSNGKLKMLNAGYTNAANIELFSTEKWEPKNAYYFNQVHFLVGKAIDNIIKTGQYKPEYGNLESAIIRQADGYITGINNLTGITKAGAVEIGKHIHYVSSSNFNTRTNKWDIPTADAWLTLDEEFYSIDGHLIPFLGWLNEGIKKVAPNRKISLYGKVSSYWFGRNYADNTTDQQIEDYYKNSYSDLNADGFKFGIYADIPGGYFKVPYILKENIYKKDAAGNFIINKGKRVYRDDLYFETVFNSTVPILPRPTPYVFQIEKRNPAYNTTESQYFVEQVYRYANKTVAGLALLNKDEFGNLDISRYKKNAKRLANAVVCPRTENFTENGNYEWRREVGETGIKFKVLFSYLSGARGVELWDNGGWISHLKDRGYNYFIDSDSHEAQVKKNTEKDWSYMGAWTSAMQTFALAMKDTDPESWQYIRFYFPTKGEQNSEPIATGIYTGDSFKYMIINPTLESNETQTVKITIGNIVSNIILTGREVYFYELPAPGGLSPRDFKLETTNIYGKKTKVNGTFTGIIAEHYEEIQGS